MSTLSTQIMAALASWDPDAEEKAPETQRSPVSQVRSTRTLKPFTFGRTTVWALDWAAASALYHG